jgi:branched-chain amino acid aminotransferase
MAMCWYRNGRWSAHEITETKPLALHPAAHVLHYASTCFEGLKAYRWADESIRVFRLDMHTARMHQSARLLCLPFPGEQTLASMVREAVSASRDVVPATPGSLYIRPTLIGTEPNIGAAGAPPGEACLYVLLSPVGSYFGDSNAGVRIVIEDEQMRSTPGFGMAKTGGNYASALRHVVRAKAQDQAVQVLFCPGGDVQETGASNFLLLNDEEVLTKPLDPSFLHGVTRDSILRLAERLGYRIVERDYSVKELFEWIEHGEAALSGTAAVLTGVGSLVHNGNTYTVGAGVIGPNTRRLCDALTDIQQGTAPDEFGWTSEV